MSDWQSIFNERGALLATFGALGGAVRSAALKTGWREGLRVIFIGSATSFGSPCNHRQVALLASSPKWCG